MLGEERMVMEDRIEEIREEMHVQFPDIEWPEPVMEPAFYGRLKKTAIPKRQAILDAKTGHVWDVVSDVYHLVTHEEVVHSLIGSVPEEYGKPSVDIRLWGNKARVRADVTFPESEKHTTEIKEGDKVNPRISAYSSYDRGTFHGTIAGAEQLICTNGLIGYRDDLKKKRKHLVFASVTPEELTAEIVNYLENFSEQTDLWREWANKQLAKTEFDEVISALPFSENEQEKILELPLMNDPDGRFLKQIETPTLWDISSAATQYARHEVRGTQRSIDLEEAIAKVLSEV